MKKIASLFAMFAMSVTLAYASDVYVQGNGTFFAPKDFDAGLGVTAKAVFPDVFAENVELATGLTIFPTSSDKLPNKDLDLFIVPVEAGYRFNIDEQLSVKPVAGVDLITSPEADTAVGGHVGVEFAYETPIEGLSAVAGVGYSFADVDVDGVKHDLDGPTASAGVTYKW